MVIRDKTEELRDRYRHPGFYPSQKVLVSPNDAGARIVRLTRRSKKQSAVDARQSIEDGMIDESVMSEILDVQMFGYFLQWKFVE